jgi:hypothetical protein
MSTPRTAAPLLSGLAFLGLAAEALLSRASAQSLQQTAGVVARLQAAPEPFGYTPAFEEQLGKIGQISPQQFAQRYLAAAAYLPRITWDPATAQFWDRLQADPKDSAVNPKGRPWGPPYDFRFNAQELALFKQNGFVVSERMGDRDFAGMFYRIYTRDLPVFISADALLQAWHRSYDALLEEIEAAFLAQSLEDILTAMAQRLPESQRQYGDGVLADCVADADYFLAVARSLLAGQPTKTFLGQDDRIAQTLTACAAQRLQNFRLFGRKRAVDFSQFKVRGHYQNSERLKHYFQAMMWCGHIDLRIAGTPEESSPRELGAAVVLHDLLQRSGKFEQWQQFDQVLQTFVGRTDSMTFAQLGDVLAKSNIRSPEDVRDLDTLQAVQSDILTGKIGLQQIRSHVYFSPLGWEKVQLPRSFTLLGQKFALDSWVTSKVVFDDILWDRRKVNRRVPSGLDVAFAALGNSQAVPELAMRMNNNGGRQFRDGLNYQHNLSAVRNVIDAQKESVWDDNLYTNWLACLRELSKPTTGSEYPQAMRTPAWAMRTLNTQLASWTQLRHDTVLYVKQSSTVVPACSYPAGYVEPVPHFWERFEKMAARAAELIAKTPYLDYVEDVQIHVGFKDQKPRYKIEWVKRGGNELKRKQATFLRNFAKQLSILREIARKEVAQKELAKKELLFLEEVVQLTRHGSGRARHGGWYPGLFYKGREDATQWDALVADVHTDLPDLLNGDPGCVLHQGVGNVDLLVIAVDNGKDRMVYAGPVASHYEFEMPQVTRKSDREWRQDLRTGKRPPRPEWTRGYLVPGNNESAKSYQNPHDP